MYFDELKYDSYDDYIRGPQWQKIKEIFYSASPGYHCRLCHSRSKLVVHKRSYAYLTPDFFARLALDNRTFLNRILVYLCLRCNKDVHFYDNGQRVPLDYLFLWEREQEIYKRFNTRVRRTWRDSRLFLLVIGGFVTRTFTRGRKKSIKHFVRAAG